MNSNEQIQIHFILVYCRIAKLSSKSYPLILSQSVGILLGLCVGFPTHVQDNDSNNQRRSNDDYFNESKY